MNRWRLRLATLTGGGVGEQLLASPAAQNVQIVQKPAAEPAFGHSEQIEHQTKPAETPERSPFAPVWAETKVVKSDGPVPRVGIPEIPDEPVLLRNGRRLWRFPAAEDCAADRADALIDQARWCGAVLIADGRELLVIERWLSNLPVDTLCELRRCASGVIAALLQQSRLRCSATSKSETNDGQPI